MKYSLKGNYCLNTFSASSATGHDGIEKTISKINPSNVEEMLWECPVGYRDAEKILSSAQTGFTNVSQVPFSSRVNIASTFISNLKENHSRLIMAIAEDTGRPIWDIEKEYLDCISILENLIAEISAHFFGHANHKNQETVLRPLGTILVITPFTLPLYYPTFLMLSGFLTGNAVILKGSEKTCLVSQTIFECIQTSGFPSGVLNLIQGDGELGKRLAKEKQIRGIYAICSKETGQSILDNNIHDYTKKIWLQLSSKNITVIDRNMDHAKLIPQMIEAAFLSTGQRCTTSPIFCIPKDSAEGILEAFHQSAKKIPVGNSDAYMGPLIDQAAIDKYLLFIGMAKRENYEEVMRGKRIDLTPRGYFVSPSIHFAEKFNPQSHFFHEELFAPSSTFFPYESIDETFEVINSLEFGLISSLFSNNPTTINLFKEKCLTGTLLINRPTTNFNYSKAFQSCKISSNQSIAGISAFQHMLQHFSIWQ